MKIYQSDNSKDFEVINLLKNREEIPKNVMMVFDNFFISNKYIQLALQAEDIGKLVVTDVFSNGYAVCDKSYFMEINFLEFVSENTKEIFFILQHRSAFYSLYIPSQNIVYCIGGEVLHHRKIITSFQTYVQREKFTSGDFNGFIVSDSRPYHYFYDCFSAYLYYVNKAPSLISKSVYGKLGRVFLKTDCLNLYSFSGRHEVTNCFNKNNKGFYLYAGRHGDSTYKKQSSRIFDRVFFNFLIHEISTPLKRPVIWFGLSEEKRKWAERDIYLEEFCKKISIRYKNPLLIFDGLTLPEGVDEEVFKKTLPDNKILIEKLSSFFDDAKVINLSGSKSLEKLKYAKHVDFYFSNALTDSIWCSKFYGKPGVAISSKKSNVKAHSHPLTFLINSEFVKDISDEKKHFSEVDFTCDAKMVCEQSEASLILNYEYLKNIYIKPDNGIASDNLENINFNYSIDGFFQINPSLNKDKNRKDLDWFLFSYLLREKNNHLNSLLPVFNAIMLDIKINIDFLLGKIDYIGIRFYSEENKKITTLFEKYNSQHNVFKVPKGTKDFQILFSCLSQTAGIFKGLRVQPLMQEGY